MAITAKKLARGAMPIGITTIYTVPTNFRTFLKGLDIANRSGAVLNVFVHLVPSGDAASNDTQFVPGVELQANDMLHWAGLQILHAGDTIQVSASIAGANIHISGAEEGV